MSGFKWCGGCRVFHGKTDFAPSRHTSDGRVGMCRQAKTRYDELYYLLNREKRNATSRDHEVRRFKANPEAFRAERRENMRAQRRRDPLKSGRDSRRWRLANPERSREISRNAMRKYRRRHPQEARASVRAWFTSEQGRLWHREHSKRYYRTHREAAFARSRKRRARKAHACGSHSLNDLVNIFRAQHGLCFYCSGELSNSRGKHLDHKVPLARGGGNGPDNLCWACPACNLAKFTKTAEEYLALRRTSS